MQCAYVGERERGHGCPHGASYSSIHRTLWTDPLADQDSGWIRAPSTSCTAADQLVRHPPAHGGASGRRESKSTSPSRPTPVRRPRIVWILSTESRRTRGRRGRTDRHSS
ncbi:hypothetical protein BS78_01G309000 [Paspalum vaginatum]|nr:hypothetical protein BS78_01G309000 [Paspalum vaginatum]